MTTNNRNARNSSSTPLTAAEEKVLTLVSESMTNKEIGAALGISLSTVKRHLENMRLKLGFRNRVEAAMYSFRKRGCPLGWSESCPLGLGESRKRL
jgi:DNA-binding CsgD family transcriptional regulator